MVSQFISPDEVNLLGDLDFDFPEGTHAVGRLDNHSEGLLILTTNKKVSRLLFLSKEPHKRKYLILVRGVVTLERLQQLREGVSIRVKGGGFYTTLPCDVDLVEKPENLPESIFAFNKEIPHSWLTISLTEGKFHQVRKMLSSIHHPVRRLIRVSIEKLNIENVAPGEVIEMQEEDFFKKLNINYNENWWK